MRPYEINEALERAAQQAYDRIRRDRRELAHDTHIELLEWVEKNIFNPAFTIETALREIGGAHPRISADLGSALGENLGIYVARRRIETAQRMLERNDLPVGQAAIAVGIPVYKVFRETYRRITDRAIVVPEAKDRLPPRFNFATWYLAKAGRLPANEIKTLTGWLRQYRQGALTHDFSQSFIAEELPVPVKASRVPRIWQQAAAEALDQISRDRQIVPPLLHRVMDWLAVNIFEGDVTVKRALSETRFRDTSMSSQFLFYLGDTFKGYVEKRKIEVAIALLAQTAIPIGDVAECVGLNYKQLLRAFEGRIGLLPSTMRKHKSSIESKPFVEFKVWRSVSQGQRSLEIIQEVWLQLCAINQGALGAEMAVGDANHASARPPTEDHSSMETEPYYTPRDATAVDEITADDANYNKSGTFYDSRASKRSPSPGRSLDGENWDAVGHVALVLSRSGVESLQEKHARRARERIFLFTPFTREIFRVREFQCAVAVAQSLEENENPKEELWAKWLRVRAHRDESDRREIDEWWIVEARLTDAPLAVRRWRKADQKREQYLDMTGGEILQAARRESAGDLYLLARNCLDVERNYHRGDIKLALRECEMALFFSEMLIDRMGLFQRAGREQMAVRDLLAVSLARGANAKRIMGSIGEAKEIGGRAVAMRDKAPLGEYAEGEVLNLFSSILRDEGADLVLAETCMNEAELTFSRFDRHLAAYILNNKAELLRIQGRPGVLDCLEKAAAYIDACRDPFVAEAVANNWLYCVARHGDSTRLVQLRKDVPMPDAPAVRASRLCIEGCIEVLQQNWREAERFLLESMDQFLALNRPGDARIAMLYLAEVCINVDNKRAALKYLETAFGIAASCGYAEAPLINELIESNRVASKYCPSIRVIAYSAGGCLGSE